MEWPPQSPDLNPIKHLWNEVDKHLRLSGSSPTSRHDLWEKIQVVWQSIEVEFVQKLIFTMPERVERVVDLLAAKAGYTRWYTYNTCIRCIIFDFLTFCFKFCLYYMVSFVINISSWPWLLHRSFIFCNFLCLQF